MAIRCNPYGAQDYPMASGPLVQRDGTAPMSDIEDEDETSTQIVLDDQSGRLIAAVRTKSITVLNACIDQGEDLEGVDETDGETALITAARTGYLEGVTALIQAKACVDRSTLHGRTALMEASLGGHMGIVQKLLDRGASALCKDRNSKTALELARGIYKRDIEQLLRTRAEKEERQRLIDEQISLQAPEIAKSIEAAQLGIESNAVSLIATYAVKLPSHLIEEQTK